MKKGIIVLIFILSCSSVSANVLSSFVKGNEAYKEQNYNEAIAQYELILTEGKSSGPIYFNLANAYYRSGQLGKAILNYKRAERLTARDSDIQFNLKYASGFVQRTDRLSENFLQKLINGHIQFYTVDEMIWIITLSVLALGLVFLLSRFFKWPRNIRYITRLVCVGVIIIFGIGFVFKVNVEKNTAILLNKTPALFEPSSGSTEHFQLYEGTMVKKVREEDGWIKVKRLDGLLGWVLKESIEDI